MTCLEWRLSACHLLLASTIGLAVEVMAASLVPLSLALSLAGGALADSLQMVPLSANPLARLVGPTHNNIIGNQLLVTVIGCLQANNSCVGIAASYVVGKQSVGAKRLVVIPLGGDLAH